MDIAEAAADSMVTLAVLLPGPSEDALTSMRPCQRAGCPLAL